YEQGGIVDAINTANPLMGLVNLGFAIDEGDWYTVGLESVGVAVMVAAVVVGKKVGPGAPRGVRLRGSVALDTNALIASVEKGQAPRILDGRAPVVPITVAKEFLQGGGSSTALRTFLTNNNGRIAAAGTEASANALQKQAVDMGRVLHRADARIVAGAAREGLPLVTNDLRLSKYLQAAKLPVEGF
ncbi:MAG TPA: hypothetical protein PK156_16875, partial [Polyangium sp.]|nr:hypothetical protein [Polyangium sp.]